MTTKLMLEIPSPNVTAMVPLYFRSLNGLSSDDYVIVSHGKGIFEFQCLKASSPVFRDDVKRNLRDCFDRNKDHIYPVSVSGLKDGAGAYANTAGSERFCTMNYDLADILTNMIKGRSAVDIIQDENGKWMELLNVSQYFRFMQYKTGGEHFPHYDSDYTYEYNGAVTKYSLVAYFTECKSGEFAFVEPKGTEFEGIVGDWNRQATDKECYLKINPMAMKILVFPHTLCHTVLPFTDRNNQRIICRGDLLFKHI